MDVKILRRLEAFEMWVHSRLFKIYKRLLKIPWTDLVCSEKKTKKKKTNYKYKIEKKRIPGPRHTD